MSFPTRPQKRSARFSRSEPFLSYARRRFAIRRGGSLSTGTARITARERISTYASITEKEQMRQHREANRLSFCFFRGLNQTGTAAEL